MPIYELSGSEAIERWLCGLDDTGRYMQYLEGFQREFSGLDDIALEDDIAGCLEAVQVQARGDVRRLTQAINALAHGAVAAPVAAVAAAASFAAAGQARIMLLRAELSVLEAYKSQAVSGEDYIAAEVM